MRQTCGAAAARRERGGARLNFLLVLIALAVVGYVGYQFVPLLYGASQYKTFMQDTVNNAAISDKPPAWVEQQLRANAELYGVPADALFETSERNNRIEARVMFTRPVPLIVTTYQYKFDNTAKSATLTAGG